MSEKIVAVSLFSGAGGLDIASFMAGVPVVSSTDFDSDCINTLKLNKDIFGETEVIEGDLHQIESSVFKEFVDKSNADKFIVIGGAPCQPFSKAGYWVGNSTRKGINDPRATLVDEYLRVVIDLQPDGFVFENVESLLHPTNKVIVERFIEIVQENGYKYKIVRANALEYGVPQKRKRLFILGTKGDFKSAEPKKTHCEPECCSGDLLPYVNVGQVIAEYDTDDYFENYEVTKGGTYHEDLCEVPPGQNYKALTAWAGYPNPKFVADKRFWSFLLKLSPDKPSWTITAQPGPWVGPFHWSNRRLRVPEIAAIQTFPKGYKFYGTRRSVQKQIGNAVPCLMGKAMIEFVKESLCNEKKKPKVVSIFSGGGGIDCGFKTAGFNICFSTDFWETACKTLENNKVGQLVLCEDIRKVNYLENLQKIGLDLTDIDVLAGGPPCPAYSKSRFYRTEKKRALEDENAFTLHEYFRALKEINPKIFFFENVFGFVYKPHKAAFDLLKSCADEYGYNITYKVVNTANYGVPQIRERFICVGVRKDFGAPFVFPEETHAKDADLENNLFKNRLPWVTCGDAIGDLDIDLPEDINMQAGSKHKDLLKLIPPGENYLFLTAEKGYPNPMFKWRSRYWSFLLKLSPEKPSWTIQASFSNNMGPFHWKNRFLRISEIKRIQTFSDYYEFSGDFREQWRQIGNAVPPKLVSQIAEAIKKQYF